MISLNETQFRKGVQFAASVLSPHNQIPILTAIKVAANGALTLEGTDLDIYARATMPYDGGAAEFILAEPRRVYAAVKNAVAESVALDVQDKRIHVKAGELTADLGASMRPDDYPAPNLVVEETFGATVGESFFRALNRLRPAISTEKTRYYLNGIYVHKIGDWLYRLVATDGHRLFLADVPLPDASGDMPDGIIIPRRAIERAIASFAKAPEGARFSLGRAQKTNRKDKTLAPSNHSILAGFSAEMEGIRHELATKLIDGTYPDYSRVVPSQHDFSIRTKRADLLKGLRCVSALSDYKTRAVRINAEKDGVSLELHCSEVGKSRFPVAAEHSAPADFYIGLNARYLLDALGALNGEEVEFGLTDPAAPMTITDPSDTAFKVVQMPMRV